MAVFVSIFYVPVNNFSVMSGQSSFGSGELISIY